MTPLEAFIEQPFGVMTDALRLHAADAPERTALILDDRRVGYRELDALVDRVAAALQRDGCRKRDAIAICAATSIEYLLVYLGAVRAGVAVAPMSPSLKPETLAAMLRDAEARILFLDDSTAALVAGGTEAPRVALDGSAVGRALADWLEPEGAKPAPVDIEPEDPFNIIYSSGTTGTPKGIVQPHSMRWMHSKRGPFYGYTKDSVGILTTPLYSNTTLVHVFPALTMGGALVLQKKFDVRGFFELVQRHRVTHAILVPVQYQRIMDHPDFDRYDLSSLVNRFATSSPFPPELKAEVLRRWPGKLVDTYGMTEGGGACMLHAHEFPDKLHTVGRPANGHTILLIDDEGREVGPGETGEIVGHSPGIMTGYRNQPALTAEAEWIAPDGRRFIRTGDVGRFDEDGFLVLMGRKKDMIISGGFNIYPVDLEAELRQHPDVADCAVVGVPSREWGETPVAFVVSRSGGQAIAADALRAWVNERLGRMQRIADLRFVDLLPRSSIGKVLKRELREAYAAG
ncbi:acyl--CoA ligase [Burkholderiaceae bacterium FT117]|uniref:class I adenylate-forming enzyme family protein n=1 Tax=Zeimonas sediminis TaxID=2944268 RepID=UPI0023430296|nr:class I adenylate-forming enzyme family protein [Zeimonas sediminis]MCM5571360.1 acyl--CoA ligase [Zeimonas sediminis]